MDPYMESPPLDLNRGPGLVVAAWIMGLAGCSLLALRMYARTTIIKKVGWDDWTMIIAVILAIVTNIVVTLMVHYGVGRHAIYLSEEQRVNAVYMIWLSVPFSPGSAAFGKVSIALLLMRLMNRSRWQEIFLWVLIFFLFGMTLVLVIVTFSQCTPISFIWNRVRVDPPPGTCWDHTIQQNVGYLQGTFSAWSDLVLALFPILIIWNLQMPLKTKIGICFLMSFGIVATVAAAVKTVELRNLATPDFTYDAVSLVYWFLAENWIIIICACVPTLKPLFKNKKWRIRYLVTRMKGKSTESSLELSSYSSAFVEVDPRKQSHQEELGATTFVLSPGSWNQPSYERSQGCLRESVNLSIQPNSTTTT